MKRAFGPDTVELDTVWVGDITYVWTWEGWAYLATVIDLASWRVVGWGLADHMRSELVCDALRMVIYARRPGTGKRQFGRARDHQFHHLDLVNQPCVSWLRLGWSPRKGAWLINRAGRRLTSAALPCPKDDRQGEPFPAGCRHARTQGSSVRVFLSYRRSDVGGYAGRLYDALVQRLGAKNVFQDVTAITPGEDFTEAIRRAIDSCDAMLAVIGPGWAASAPEGRPRLIEPDDYVRVELATALKREVPVVPVLLGGARLPAAADLPDDLAPLAQRQGVAVRDEVWHQDVDRLLRSLRGETAVPTRRSRWRAGGAVALALAALGAVGWLQWAGGGDGEQEAATVAPCVPPGGAGWASLPIGQQATGTVNRDAGSLEYTVREARWRPLEPGRWQLSLETSMANRTPEDTYHGDWNYDSVLVGQRAFKKSCFSPTPDLVLPGAVGDALVGFDVTCEPAGYIELVLGNSAARIKVTDAPEPGSC